MRGLKDIKSIVFGIIWKHRIKTNNIRYNELYKLGEHKGMATLIYKNEDRAFNWRMLHDHNLVYRYIYNKTVRDYFGTVRISKNY